MSGRRDPWRWLDEGRLTFAVKLLLALVLLLFLGGAVASFLGRVRAIVYILIGAIFFAYLIYPAVERLSKKMPRAVAILAVYLGIAIVLVLAGWFIAPPIASDVAQLVTHSPEAAAQVSALFNDPQNPLVTHLPPWMRAELAQAPDQVLQWVQQHGLAMFGHALGVIVGTVAAIATFVIIPMLSAYLLLDIENIRNGFRSLFSDERAPGAMRLLAELDDVIGSFIRGQLLVATTVGVLITIGLLILHVKYAFLLGLLAAVGDLIPYVGAVLAFVPSFFIALIGNGWTNAIIVSIVFLVIFQGEGHLIAPNILSRNLKLSPLIVLMALLVGGDLAGILGMLVAVPIAGMLRVLAGHILNGDPKT